MKQMALLLADGYKHTHAEQFPKKTTKLVSYMTPRKSRLKYQDYMIFFGLQAFCKDYLIDYFNDNFFNKNKKEIIEEYKRVLDSMLGETAYSIKKIIDLYDLGHLPIEIKAVDEGTKVPMTVPCLEISNTHEDFAWVVQWCESLISCELWKSCIHANVGHTYRQVVNKYYDLTVDGNNRSKAMSDFGFRGLSSLQESMKASSAWLLSFSGTATIPAVQYLEKFYNCNNTNDRFASNLISTEHAVMASNFAVDGDEITMVKRLLTEIYPNNSFSMVSDTYDLDNLVNNILPQCKEEILNHNGKIIIRPDSGDIVDVAIRTVNGIYKNFKGKTNSKGYKTLDSHIGVVYGDGVMQEVAEEIYKKLMDEGYASDVIAFGAGSFSFNAIKEDGEIQIYTRDTFSVAIKATYGIVDGKEIEIFKDPKTDRETGNGFKKSQKGLCHVFDDNGIIKFKDGLNKESFEESVKLNKNLLTAVFKDGKMIKEQTLSEIRNKLHGKNF